MICPGIAVECDNPGCRHGGCQGRPPQRQAKPPIVPSGIIVPEWRAERAPERAQPLPPKQPIAPQPAA